jgi:hypothetical protein
VRSVDDANLATLRSIEGLGVYDSYVTTENDGVTVNYPTPYAVYYSSVGDDSAPRLSGRTKRRSVFWSITYVGLSREQAKWAGELIRAALEGTRPTVADATGVGLIKVEESQRVRRDDDAIRPDGSPLFYGVDNYSLPININRN